MFNRILLATLLSAGCVSGGQPEANPQTTKDSTKGEAPMSGKPVTNVSRSTQEAGRVSAVPVATGSAKASLTWNLVELAAKPGATAAAPQPAYAFDLDAKQFPARALDPVLVVGEQTLTRYRYISRDVLRFEVPPQFALREGVRVSVQYGNDVTSQRELTKSLSLSSASPSASPIGSVQP